jgi:hypothetical protein
MMPPSAREGRRTTGPPGRARQATDRLADRNKLIGKISSDLFGCDVLSEVLYRSPGKRSGRDVQLRGETINELGVGRWDSETD